MEPGSRTTREQRSGMRDDNPSTGGQDNPASQGKWEHRASDREDDTGGQGGDTYTGQSDNGYGNEYGTNTFEGTGPGGVDIQPDRYTTSGYGGPESVTTQTAGYADPISGGRRPEDDEYGAAVGGGGGGTGKPSMKSRVMGAAEKMTGKIRGDPDKQARGREREEGTF